MANNKTGLFITIEGGEATGKTTQIGKLKQYFAGDSAYFFTREPGGTIFAEKLREIIVSGDKDKMLPMSELLLFNAARYDHVHKVIIPKIKSGINVICDRFFDSTIAYQSSARGLDKNLIFSLHEIVMGNFFPDITLLLDLAPEIALKRVKERQKSEDERFEKFPVDFHQKVRDSFLELARNSERNIKVIDASLSEDEIFQKMCQEITNYHLN